jgi:hypothetical protein
MMLVSKKFVSLKQGWAAIYHWQTAGRLTNDGIACSGDEGMLQLANMVGRTRSERCHEVAVSGGRAHRGWQAA